MTKPRRKKAYMLLRGFSGNFIVVRRVWYDSKGIAKQRGRVWKIAAQHDDEAVLKAMAGMTDKLRAITVNHETIDETKGNKC